MQYPVPQFIDVEDKIIGPFTLKQFGFIFGGGILIVGIFKLLGTGFLFFIFAVPIGIASAILAFGSFNGRRMYDAIPVLFKFVSSDKLYIFKQKKNFDDIDVQPITAELFKKSQPVEAVIEEPVQSKLKRLSMLLDSKNREEFETITNRKERS